MIESGQPTNELVDQQLAIQVAEEAERQKAAATDSTTSVGEFVGDVAVCVVDVAGAILSVVLDS